jgi:hypothetical protein
MNIDKPLGARLGISAVLEFRDAAGNIIKSVDATASIPLSDLDLTVDEARNLIIQHEGADHGADDCK